MRRFRLQLTELERKKAVPQLSLYGWVRETYVSEISESHRFHKLAVVEEVLIFDSSTLTQYLEGITRGMDSLCDVSNFPLGVLSFFVH